MANIRTATQKMFRIENWLGLNEAPDGDSKLKLGEASVCNNWRVTRDRNMRRRPGTRVEAMYSGAIHGMWSGRVASSEYLVYAAGTKLYAYNGTTHSEIGNCSNGHVSFIPWDLKLYILDGVSYQVWDGVDMMTVDGYRPIVTQNVSPTGGGDLLEGVNLLTPAKRCWFSPDGTATEFVLPESSIASVDWVKDLGTGASVSYTADLLNGKVTLDSAPSAGSNTLEIAWTGSTSMRSRVCSKNYHELYNGANDNRIFLYGDGTNKTIYSGISHEDGQPRADYFPELNEIAVGDENDAVTGLIRHYSRMIAFKGASTWVIAYSTMTLQDGSTIASFFCTPANRSLGNVAMGQTQLVLNSARSLCNGACYEWRNNSSYTANLTVDERQAKRVSDKVNQTLSSFVLSDCITYDDNDEQEYYICYGERALVHNYAVDAWYCYNGIKASCFARYSGSLYIGTTDGYLLTMSQIYMVDYVGGSEKVIDAWYESGSMAFGAENLRKYYAEAWVSARPQTEGGFGIRLIADSNPAIDNTIQAVGSDSAFDFGAVDFSNLSFGMSALAYVVNRRLVARRFDYLKLVFYAGAEQNGSVLSILFNITYGGKKM